MLLGFCQHRLNFGQLTWNSIHWNLVRARRASDWRPDGRCTLGVERQVACGHGPIKMGSIWEDLFRKSSRVDNKAAGKETRVARRPGVVCIRRLLVLLRIVDAIRRGTRLGASFNGSVLVGFPGSLT